jgi:hypothetical protein
MWRTPAFCAAAIAISAWLSPGVETSTTSTSGRAITSRQALLWARPMNA